MDNFQVTAQWSVKPSPNAAVVWEEEWCVRQNSFSASQSGRISGNTWFTITDRTCGGPEDATRAGVLSDGYYLRA